MSMQAIKLRTAAWSRKEEEAERVASQGLLQTEATHEMVKTLNPEPA